MLKILNLFLSFFKKINANSRGHVFVRIEKEKAIIENNSRLVFKKYSDTNKKNIGIESNWPWKLVIRIVMGFRAYKSVSFKFLLVKI